MIYSYYSLHRQPQQPGDVNGVMAKSDLTVLIPLIGHDDYGSLGSYHAPDGIDSPSSPVP